MADAKKLKELSINAVRIPVGWWIFESLKEPSDLYPNGVLIDLKRVVKMLKQVDIVSAIDWFPSIALISVQHSGR